MQFAVFAISPLKEFMLIHTAFCFTKAFELKTLKLNLKTKKSQS